MIFVTVGTHEQPFNRLVAYVDELKKNKIITDKIIIQIGFSTYEPQYCEWSNWYSYQDMAKYVDEARIVITHGGPSSFIMPLQVGKIPIVVPRKKAFNEHVNDHQVVFANAVAERQKNIIVVEEIDDLKAAILNYDSNAASLSKKISSNNAEFNRRFQNIVDELFLG